MKTDFISRSLDAEIDWNEVVGDEFNFFAYVEGTKLTLTLNDFPEEPLCTVSASDSRLDLWDFPKTWTLPRHRNRDKHSEKS